MNKEQKIEEFEKENYPNLLDELKLPYDEMKKKLKKMTYISAKKFVEETATEEEKIIENFKSLPFFNETILNYVKKNRTIPSQDEFINQYWSDNTEELSSFTSNEFKQAINNRAIRAYPSLIRDIMFAYFIKDKINNKNVDVIYNCKLDRDGHIDIMICGKYNWGLHLFTNTKRANDFRQKKNNRGGILFTNVIELDLELDMSRKREKYGNVFLYDEIDFQHLLELCKNYKI